MYREDSERSVNIGRRLGSNVIRKDLTWQIIKRDVDVSFQCRSSVGAG